MFTVNKRKVERRKEERSKSERQRSLKLADNHSFFPAETGRRTGGEDGWGDMKPQ